jgi:hypothetical protein
MGAQLVFVQSFIQQISVKDLRYARHIASSGVQQMHADVSACIEMIV